MIFPSSALARAGAWIAVGSTAGIFLQAAARRMFSRLSGTRLGPAQEHLRERTEELERAAAAKTAFVNCLSHEIRNPLNGIMGASFALAEANLTAADREHAETVRACAAHLSALVGNVLDLAQVEAGAIEIRCEVYDPRAVLVAVKQMLSAQAAAASVALAFTVSPVVPLRVLGDCGRIRQVLVNFVVNAIKFAPNGPVDLVLERADGWLVFSVADRGPGIDAADKSRLFAPFSRLESARLKGIAGSGLGLAISRTMAERMGGSVGVQDREGGGAVFWLRVPCEAAAETPHEAEIVPAQMAGGRALILEDVDYNAAALEHVLQRMGFTCVRAKEGRAALDRLRTETYDTVFVDCDLPGMSGLDFVRTARRLPAPGLTPVFIATTASIGPAARQACLAAGMDEFVGKPITPASLHRALTASALARLASPSVQLAPAEPAPPRDILAYLGGETEAGQRESRRRFLEALEDSRGKLDRSAHAGDRDGLRRAAHHLVAQSRMVNAEPLAALAERIEAGAPALPLAELVALAGEISETTRQVAENIQGTAPTPEPA